MLERLIAYLNDVPLAGIMLVVAIGWLLGRLEWRGIGLSPSGGVLVLALVFGYLGMNFDALYGARDGDLPRMTIGMFGFALFIYAIGFEAGPRFFSALSGAGLKFVVLAVVVNVLALGTAVGGAWLFDLQSSSAAGALAGAMTSTPALVAASEVAPDIGRLSVAYALAYPWGQLGLLLMVAVVPRLVRQPLSGGPEEAAESDRAETTLRERTEARSRTYQVTNAEVDGKSLRELRLPDTPGCIVTRVKRGGEVMLPGPDVILKQNDLVMASGQLRALEQLEALLGPETFDPDLRRSIPAPRRILVTHKDAIGKTLAELDLLTRYKCVVVRVEREEQYLDPTGSLELQRFDVLEVVGRQARIREAAQRVGHLEQADYETNIAIYALGILVGLLIGHLQLDIGGVGLSLGAAGGLLLVGLLLGRFRRVGRFSANVPKPARQLVRDLGILLFISEAGVRGGDALRAGLDISPWGIVLTGFVCTTGTVLGTLLVARKLLRMKAIDAWGGLCGGMTSTTSLEAVNRQAGNNDAVIGYAATYAVASVLITLAGQLAVALT
jgi:putative transport protein